MSETAKQFRSMPAVLVPKPEKWTDIKEGEFFFFEREKERGIVCRIPTNREVSTIDYLCVEGDAEPVWNWNSNREKPELEPSIKIYDRNMQVVWHGYLRGGKWEAC